MAKDPNNSSLDSNDTWNDPTKKGNITMTRKLIPVIIPNRAGVRDRVAIPVVDCAIFERMKNKKREVESQKLVITRVFGL
ncbi:MAG: hypothetical protein AAGM46_14085 [Cyanobacteria bacterium J06582_2]